MAESKQQNSLHLTDRKSNGEAKALPNGRITLVTRGDCEICMCLFFKRRMFVEDLLLCFSLSCVESVNIYLFVN